MKFLRHKKRWAIGAAAVLVAAVAFHTLYTPAALETGSWGLSFQTEGQTPVGNASQKVLSQYDAAFVGDTSEQVLYLTFDAGYENGCTEQILDTLQAHQVPAAFFLVGNYLEQNPELVQRMVQDGHTVGNHTYHHYDMSKISDEDTFRQELESLESLFYEVTGTELPHYYRPPQGCYSEQNLSMAQQMGYQTVFWSLAYVDWYQDQQPTREQAMAKLIPRTHPGAVILLHSTSTTNAEILDDLLTTWENLGYSFGTLDDLFQSDR